MEIIWNAASALSSADILTLTALALVDATSAGTLLVPLVLLLVLANRSTGALARQRAGGAERNTTEASSSTPASDAPAIKSPGARVAVYLVSIAIFYWLVGLTLMAGLHQVLEPINRVLSSHTAAVAMVALGLSLLVLSWWLDPKVIRKRGGDPEAGTQKWVTRAQRAAGSWRNLAALAVLAGLIELATMLPYLAAMGSLAQSDLGGLEASVVLALYCLVMITPALLLTAAHALFGQRLQRPLTWIRDWAIRTAPTTLAWILGIVGVVILVRTVPAVMGT